MSPTSCDYLHIGCAVFPFLFFARSFPPLSVGERFWFRTTEKAIYAFHGNPSPFPDQFCALG